MDYQVQDVGGAAFHAKNQWNLMSWQNQWTVRKYSLVNANGQNQIMQNVCLPT